MYRLFIALPAGFSVACPDLVLWGIDLGWRLRQTEDLSGFELFYYTKGRIGQARNLIVAKARASRCTHLLMLDPDIVPDRYLQVDPEAVRWWTSAWPFMVEHPGCVVATPYRGAGPNTPVQVFSEPEGIPGRKPVRLPSEQAASLAGWRAVDAVGTGLMLIDMTVFDKLDDADRRTGQHRAFFHDTYSDYREAALLDSQDIYFCMRCGEAGVPVYVNFDCWAGHWQNQIVEAPVRTYDKLKVFDGSEHSIPEGRIRPIGPRVAGPDLPGSAPIAGLGRRGRQALLETGSPNDAPSGGQVSQSERNSRLPPASETPGGAGGAVHPM